MQIIAAAGLAQKFAALLLAQTKRAYENAFTELFKPVGANDQEKKQLIAHFKEATVSNAGVKEALEKLRN